ncbi:hypothetical protein [Paenibacillus sp. 481]|uniref:hypothetical protein n=1 Tax=Paenibacillus sp. 481 TaxID=2835869 RepID=UPI001E5B9D11|nr:hypothetical protein [Paenibacillus sp. 481]UHA72702.1 hypothetical protein KIK04_18985 [Paenibacillus sp. 481]
MTYQSHCLWFFIKKELSDIAEDIKDVLHYSVYERDYENTWEWIDFRNAGSNDIQLNISREHNWKHGLYDCPVVVRFTNDSRAASLEEIEAIGYAIFKRFDIKVYVGQVHYVNSEDGEFKFVIEQEFGE